MIGYQDYRLSTVTFLSCLTTASAVWPSYRFPERARGTLVPNLTHQDALGQEAEYIWTQQRVAEALKFDPLRFSFNIAG